MPESSVHHGRLFIVDPSFVDWVGHHAPYDLAVLNAAEAKGFDVWILANRKVSLQDVDRSKIAPVFSKTAWGDAPDDGSQHGRHLASILDWLQKTWCDVKSFFAALVFWVYFFLVGNASVGSCAENPAASPLLRRLIVWAGFRGRSEFDEATARLEKKGFGAGDILLHHMISDFNFAAACRLADWASRRGGKTVLLFRYPFSFMAFSVLRNRLAMAFLQSVFTPQSIHLATDSELLTQAYAKMFALPFSTLPIPHTFLPTRHSGNDTNVLKCVSLGNARAEKGIVEIMQAIRLLAKRGDQRFSFELQINDADQGCKAAVNRFSEREFPGVLLHNRPLKTEDYARLLQSADVVLLPYHPDVYRERTSGILLEALGADKLIICTDETWMSLQMRTYGGAGVILDRCDPEKIVAALEDIHANRTALQYQAAEAGLRCRQDHSGPAFVDALVRGLEKC